MLNNSKILLTVFIGGRLGATVSNAASKELISKIKVSPFEHEILSKNGKSTGKYITPKGHFAASNDFKERGELPCSRSITLSESCVNYFISAASCPYFIKKGKWEKMHQKERLEVHLSINAEGNKYSYEVI